MVVKIADNILSPLGKTTQENLQAVQAYRSALSLHRMWDVPEPFMASLFAEDQLEEHSYEGALRQSITQALVEANLLPGHDASGKAPRSGADASANALASDRTLLILSSTKGQATGPEGEPMGQTARRLARHFGLTTDPITVSNACISGLSAQILAMRMLEMGECDLAIVAGCDIQSKFIVSGFQSFHAVSDEECRPFDEDRFGLNLGEAAATVIYARSAEAASDQWVLTCGAVRNDAFHISSPSKTGEGCFRALHHVMQGVDAARLACISAHGTATLYNDDMESRAIARAGLSDVLVCGLKGYYGHTMGAAGLLETILTMHAIDDGWVPGTRGYQACGTMCELNVSPRHVATDKRQFVKLMSGFGGCNAAALFKKGDEL